MRPKDFNIQESLFDKVFYALGMALVHGITINSVEIQTIQVLHRCHGKQKFLPTASLNLSDFFCAEADAVFDVAALVSKSLSAIAAFFAAAAVATISVGCLSALFLAVATSSAFLTAASLSAGPARSSIISCSSRAKLQSSIASGGEGSAAVDGINAEVEVCAETGASTGIEAR